MNRIELVNELKTIINLKLAAGMRDEDADRFISGYQATTTFVQFTEICEEKVGYLVRTNISYNNCYFIISYNNFLIENIAYLIEILIEINNT